MEVVAEGGFDLLAFVFAEEAVIDEYADEAVAYGFVEQGGGNGGIDASAEAADNRLVARRATWIYWIFLTVSATKSLIFQSPAQPQIS